MLFPTSLTEENNEHDSTLDAIEIDIGHNIFASGQAYTAISRAKNLKSVKINSVLKSSFITDPEVLGFYGEI